jgi:hypothetical protein
MSVMSTTLKPVISLISDEIFARLQTLVSGSVGAYAFAKVVRPTKVATYTPQNGLIVLTRGEIVRVTDLDCVGNPPAIAYMQTFLIRVHIAPSEKDTTPLELFEDVAEAEIHRAIRTSDTWYQFNDNAINADFGAQQTATSDGGYDGIAIPLMVTYRVAEGDPYTVRA